jgi:hypothetical protein
MINCGENKRGWAMPNTFRVKTWQEFKQLAYTKNPKSIVYVIAQSIPSRDHTGLRLILPVESAQYIFIDSAKGDVLRRTGIPIRTNPKGNRFLTDEDVKRFLRTELQIKDLKIFSYWTA